MRTATKGGETLWETNPQRELVTALQARVEAWAASGYEGASELSRRLLQYWFGDMHLLADGKTFFQWHPHQRRAVETVIYLYEVSALRRVEAYADHVGLERRAQKADWAKIGLQMATGSGKTKVMSLLMTWAHLQWQIGDNSDALGLGNVQLLLAPNLIVLERLLADFADGKIFDKDPLIPPELRRDFALRVVTPDSVPSELLPSQCYLVVANIQKVYAPEPTAVSEADADAQADMFAQLDTPVPTKLDMGTARLLQFVQSATTPILVYNDEAHHVHDEGVHYAKNKAAVKDEDEREGIAWNRALLSLQKQAGIALQCDLSATLFEESSKQWFRHTVYDYPLQQAIRDRIVKQPYLCKLKLQYKDGYDEVISKIDNAALNAFDKYTHLLQAGIAEWKKEQKAIDAQGVKRKALMFIVCANKTEAKEVAARLEEFPDADTGECLFAGKVIEIHIGRKEATNEKDWQKIRADIQQVDSNDTPYTAIVSVMMLKEGWDVRNVKVIVPLRPCDSRQLTEQMLGRGLRRMFPPYWTPEGELKDRDRAEGLYVIEHPSFSNIIKNVSDILEEEPDDDAKRPSPTRVLVRPVEPAEERAKRDLPITQIIGAFDTEDDWVERIGRGKMPPLAVRFPYVRDLKEIEGIIRHEGAVLPKGDTKGGSKESGNADTDTIVYDVQQTGYTNIDYAINSYADAIRAELRLSRDYQAAIKGILKAFLERCTFDLKGIPLSMEAAAEADEETQRIVIHNICRSQVRQQAIQSVAKIIGMARAGKETPDVQLDRRYARDLTEFETSPSVYCLQNPRKCVHTACHFDSSEELRLAEMLDEADDVAGWLWNDQSGVGFRIQYSFEGRTPYYYPDFLVKLTNGKMIVIESKGSIRERDRAKQTRAERYAAILSEATQEEWSYLFLVNDSSIGRRDIAWWRQQGRVELRDLVKYISNAPTGTGELF